MKSVKHFAIRNADGHYLTAEGTRRFFAPIGIGAALSFPIEGVERAISLLDDLASVGTVEIVEIVRVGAFKFVPGGILCTADPADEREALRAAYVREVGYDPFEDDPTVSEADVRRNLSDFRAENA